MASYYVRDLVTDAYRDAGVIGVDAVPSANEAADAVRTLNRILDGLALESLTAPGKRTLSVNYPANTEYVEFIRGAAVEPWQIAVPEIVLLPIVVSVVDGATLRAIPFMDAEEFFSRDYNTSGYASAWHWENTQAPRLYLADPPSSGAVLRIVAPCDPYRDVDLNTDLTAWRVGLRPLLCSDLAANIARQNGNDASALSQMASNAKAAYARSVRSPSVVRMDASAPGVRGSVIDVKSGNWL